MRAPFWLWLWWEMHVSWRVNMVRAGQWWRLR